ncbi:protein FAR1-RELATED SEQUENCE 5-like [Iris pallida]|uniref:Protein FAR1-RELATED SEQUENCE 5-like n=1 Tax=Iris pallida TaxID=29817 RepID=A0AAX6ETW0_IRIPA|nr:protein FAR1-RELATED SEQUENCE 5-like [Iris pallida]
MIRLRPRDQETKVVRPPLPYSFFRNSLLFLIPSSELLFLLHFFLKNRKGDRTEKGQKEKKISIFWVCFSSSPAWMLGRDFCSKVTTMSLPLSTPPPLSTITGEAPYKRGDGVDLGDGVGDGNTDDLDIITPKIGMEFATQKDAYNFYNGYALKMGFGTRWSSTSRSRSDPNLVISRLIVCSKEGKRRVLKKPIVDEEVDHRREIRFDCKAMIKIYLTKSGRWRIGKFVPEHNNHELSTPSKTVKHRSHKKVHRQPVVKNLITQLHSEGISNASIARVVNSFEPDPQHLITPQQVHDHLRVERKNNLGKNCAKIVKHFMEKKAEDPTFYSSIELDDDYTLRSVFWADRRSQESYQKFSDVIIFDVTYRTNNFCLPFAPFTGINHHRQSSLFGCALLADETEQTFV